MASITQLPAALDLTGIAGDQFALTLDVGLVSGGSDLPSGDLSNPVVEVTSDGDLVAVDVPVVTNPAPGQYRVVWSEAQTADLLAIGACRWSLSFDVLAVTSTVLGGALTMVPSTTGGGSNSTTADLTVQVGGVAVDLTISLGAAGSVSGVEAVVGGVGITVDSTDPAHPIVTATGVRSVVAGTNVTVDNTDPENPIVSSSGGQGGGAVASVNGHTGTVVLAAADVGAPTTAALTSEASTRATADSGLSTGLATESVTRGNADTALGALISTETARATGAEASFTTLVTTETNRATGAEATITGLVTTERNRATGAEATKLTATNNLSDVANAATARTNLGLGSAATQPTSAFDAAGAAAAAQAVAIAASDSAGAAAAAQSAAIAASAQRASNLSDLASAATARTNLGLGSAAQQAASAFDAAGAAAAAQAAAIAASDASGAAAAAQAAAIAASAQRASNLSDLANAATARTNLGLGSAATQASAAFDAAGAAATETTRAQAAEALLGLIPTAVKTANYTAVAGDFVPCDTSATAAFTVLLPNAPPDKTRVGIKYISVGAGKLITYACQGTDHLNSATGATSGVLTIKSQSETFQYVASTGVWYLVAGDSPLGQLDLRYPNIANTPPIYNALFYGVVADGVTDDTAAWNALAVTIALAGGGAACLPAGKRSLCSGALNPMPFGASSPALRIFGLGSVSPFLSGAASNGASILDLRYNGGGSSVAKIDCRGYGRLELDHITLVSGGADNYPFFQTTNSCVHIHDSMVIGNTGNSGSSCVQDAFVIGGNNLNDLLGTLSGNINASVTTISTNVALGATGTSFVIAMDAEQMLVTAGAATTTLTVTRGYNGTTAASHTGGAAITTGASDQPFQGYGSVIERVGFSHIRTGVLLQGAANALVVGPNTFGTTCGGDSTHGAIMAQSTSGARPTGNVLLANLIESVHYVYPFVFGTNADHNIGIGNGIWDATGSTLAAYKDASGNVGNRFWGTYTSTTDHPDAGSLTTITSGVSFTPTATGTYMVICVGGGGGGAGGGTSTSTISQVGGGGGGQGGSAVSLMALVGGTPYTVAIGAGGIASAAAAAVNGHAGTAGSAGNATTFNNGTYTLTGAAGAGGVAGGASSTTGVGGGTSSVTANLTAGGNALSSAVGVTTAEGWGGGSGSFSTLSGSGGAPSGYGAGGGGGGGTATSTHGGSAGAPGAFSQAAAGTNGGNGSSVNGADASAPAATSYGAGGGGGGGGATAGGLGGKGGAGGPGVIYVIGPF